MSKNTLSVRIPEIAHRKGAYNEEQHVLGEAAAAECPVFFSSKITEKIHSNVKNAEH